MQWIPRLHSSTSPNVNLGMGMMQRLRRLSFVRNRWCFVQNRVPHNDPVSWSMYSGFGPAPFCFVYFQAFIYTRLDTINTLQNCLLNRHSWGKTPKRKWGKFEMNARVAVNTKGQEPKILFRRVKWKQIIYRIFLSPPPLLLEKGWDKPTAMDFWFSRHLNCLLGKFKYYGTSPSTFIWPKMPKKNAHFSLGKICLAKYWYLFTF